MKLQRFLWATLSLVLIILSIVVLLKVLHFYFFEKKVLPIPALLGMLLLLSGGFVFSVLNLIGGPSFRQAIRQGTLSQWKRATVFLSYAMIGASFFVAIPLFEAPSEKIVAIIGGVFFTICAYLVAKGKTFFDWEWYRKFCEIFRRFS